MVVVAPTGRDKPVTALVVVFAPDHPLCHSASNRLEHDDTRSQRGPFEYNKSVQAPPPLKLLTVVVVNNDNKDSLDPQNQLSDQIRPIERSDWWQLAIQIMRDFIQHL